MSPLNCFLRFSYIYSFMFALNLPPSSVHFLVTLCATLLSLVSAQLSKRNDINDIAAKGAIIYIGIPFTLEWKPTTESNINIDIELYNNATSGSNSVVANISNTGSYKWTPSSDISPMTGYYLGVRTREESVREELSEFFEIRKYNGETVTYTTTISTTTGGTSAGATSTSIGTTTPSGNSSPSGSADPGATKSSSSGAMIGGIVAGCVCTLLLIVGIVFFVQWKKRKARDPVQLPDFAGDEGPEFIPGAPVGPVIPKKKKGLHQWERVELAAKSVGPDRPNHGRHELDAKDLAANGGGTLVKDGEPTWKTDQLSTDDVHEIPAGSPPSNEMPAGGLPSSVSAVPADEVSACDEPVGNLPSGFSPAALDRF